MNQALEPSIGIIGGSGLYQFDDFEKLQELDLETPFGKPSDRFIVGRIADIPVVFLPRHGRHHTLLPSEIPHRANIWGMKKLGIKWIVSVSAVGSLQAQHIPGHVVLIDQFFDRNKGHREPESFFGQGIVAHISFDNPISGKMRKVLLKSAITNHIHTVNGGTYVNIQGPAFSTRAESIWYHRNGFDVIGMTNLPEAKLAREAEIAYATMAMVTDYDSWHAEHNAVSVEQVLHYLRLNNQNAQKIILHAIPHLARLKEAKAHTSLKYAILTPENHWPEQTAKKLDLLIGKYRKQTG